MSLGYVKVLSEYEETVVANSSLELRSPFKPGIDLPLIARRVSFDSVETSFEYEEDILTKSVLLLPGTGPSAYCILVSVDPTSRKSPYSVKCKSALEAIRS